MGKYPKWKDGIKHTDPRARITKWRNEESVRVIEVYNASYRNAVFSDVFQLEQGVGDPIYIYRGDPRVKVVCSWYYVIPSTTYPQINLANARYQIIENYSGLVADNIGQ